MSIEVDLHDIERKKTIPLEIPQCIFLHSENYFIKKEFKFSLFKLDFCFFWYYLITIDTTVDGNHENLIIQGDSGGPLQCNFKVTSIGIENIDPLYVNWTNESIV